MPDGQLPQCRRQSENTLPSGHPDAEGDNVPKSHLYSGPMTRNKDTGDMKSTDTAGIDDLVRMLSRSLLPEVHRHARKAYPNECCGMILASGVRHCRNLAEDRPARPGEREPSARSAFELDAADCIFLAKSLAGRDPVLALYHSHPDGTAVFSRADRNGATLLGRAIYPSVLHLVISCDSNTAGEARLFRLEDDGVIEIAHFADDPNSGPNPPCHAPPASGP